MATNSDRLSVLVVEDEPLSRSAIAREVKGRGHHCVAAADGAEGWEHFQREPFDIVLSDWRMPRMDGVELCRRVRAEARPTGSYVAFIMMTAHSDREHLLTALGAGVDEYLIKPIDLDELQLRLAAAERIVRSQRELRRDSEGSFKLARVDALTGVGNRLRMEEDLRRVIDENARYGRGASLALCDVDHFKNYNDVHGHVAGDEVLRRVAGTLCEVFRGSDVVYRYGGEEFVVVFPEQTAGEATAAVERARAEVERACDVTLSAGVARLGEGDDMASWLEAADAALYRAKAAGRNRVVAA